MNSSLKSPVGYDVVLIFPRKRLTYTEAMFPMGLASIAAVAENAGFRVKLLDLNVYKGSLLSDLKEWRPKLIGIGGTTPTRKSVFKLSRLVKAQLPETVIVYGGPHAAFTAQDTLRGIPEIDYTVAGEGEYPFLSLCQKFISGDDIKLNQIPGLAFREGDIIIQNPPERINDLGVLPLPARYLLAHQYPIKLDFFDVQADFIMTSRGCPVQCVFCSASAMYKGGVRVRPIDQIREEIISITKNGLIKGLKIFDSTFTSEAKHVKEFCSMVKPFNMIWECEVRADTVDYDLLKIMKEAGCVYIDLGLESSNPKFLNMLNKNISLDQVLQVIDWCDELGIKVKLFLIFGHPGQTFRDCLQEISFIKTQRKRVAFFDVGIGMRIYPGTQLEVIARKKGLIRQDFSWIKFKPPWRRAMIGDLSDVMTLEQKKLNFYHLTFLALILHLRGLIITRTMYQKIFAQYFRGFLDKINIFRRNY